MARARAALWRNDTLTSTPHRGMMGEAAVASAAPTVHEAAAMIGRRTVHAFALMTTLIAAQLAARSVLAHLEPHGGEGAREVAASR